MNEDLSRRYRLLFEAYDNGGIGMMLPIRQRLMAMLNQETIRPDGALYLLSNLDQMITRPYYGQIIEIVGGTISELLPEFDPATATDTLLTAFNKIVENLDGEVPYSSHAVSLAIEKSWSELAELFLWG